MGLSLAPAVSTPVIRALVAPMDPAQLAPQPELYRTPMGDAPQLGAAGAPIPPPPGFPPIRPVPSVGADNFTKFLGFTPKPGAMLPRPGPLIVTWLAPQPFGVTPPSVLGLPENYLLGYTPTEVIAPLLMGPNEYLLEAARYRAQKQTLEDAARLSATRPFQGLTDEQFTAAARQARQIAVSDADRIIIDRTIADEIGRRVLERNTRERLGALPATPGITPGESGPMVPGQVVWPEGGAGGAFLDSLTALLPPDP